MGSKGSNTTTASYKPPKIFMDAYKEALGMAREATSQPYQQYKGQLVAGLTPSQQQGIANVNAAQGMALPAIQQGMNYTNQAAQGITPELYQRFYSPYVKDVANTTFANLMESQAQQQSNLKGGAINAGAFGGDRGGIAQAEMARQQQLANSMAMSNIYNQGYGQAMGLAGQQVSNLGAMGQQIAGLGAGAQSSVLQGAQAQMAAGAQQQATEQARLQAAYEQWMQRQSYPYQQAQFFANIAQGLGAGAGGTSSTTAPAPSIFSQIAGAAGAIGSIYGASDKRVKENIEAVGKLNDGQTIYRYNFKGDPKTEIGLLAQEVEHHKPGAVAEIKGLKMVNYKDATEDSASMGGVVGPSEYRQGLAGGGEIPYHPYGDARSYVPEGKAGGQGDSIAKRAPTAPEDQGLAKDWQEIMPLSKEQAAGLRKLAGDAGIDLPEKGDIAAIFNKKVGPTEAEKAWITLSNPGYASGGLVGRPHYAGGGVMDQAIDEAAGLGAAVEPNVDPTLARMESGNNFRAKNAQGYVGRMQFGPDRLIDVKRAGVIPAEMTSEDFRNDENAQKAAEKWHFSDINNFIDKTGLASVEGKSIKGIPVTREGLVNVAHLGGKGGLQKFVASGGRYDPADDNGTHLSDYLALGAKSGGVGDAVPVPASAEGLAAAEDVTPPESGGLLSRIKFDPSKLIASEDNPSLIEKIMGRRLSPEARAAVMNASFALMAGRSPFFLTNVGEAGKVGMQTYYNALQQGVDIQSKQAETQRKIFEIQKANADFYGPLLQNAIINNNGVLPQNMVPLLQKMGPFAEAYISSVQGQLPGGNAPTEPVIPAPQMPQTMPVATQPAPAVSPGGVSGGTSEIPPATGEEGVDQTGATSTAPAATSTSTSPQTPDLRVPFLRPVDDPIALQAAKAKAGPAMYPIYDAKINESIARIAANNGSYLGADGKLHAYPGWQELVAQQESLKTRATEGAKAEYDLVEVIDPETNQKIKVPRSEVIKNKNITELSPAEKVGSEESKRADVKIVSDLSSQMSDMQSGFPSRTLIIDGLRESVSNAETGKFAEFKADIVNAMNTFGLANADMVDEAADLQTAMKYFAQSILDSGMKDKIGPQISNADLTLVAKGQGTIENLPAANRRIIGAMYGKLMYDKAKTEAWDQYIAERGGIQNISAAESREWQRKFGEENKIGEFVNRGIAETPVAGELSVKRNPDYFKQGYQYIDPKTGRPFVVMGFKEVNGKKMPVTEYVNE